ncbi:hypothetical protein W909_19680 [Dickeya zeae EC1]|nr:hypothetical protein W909_19680 [Dickeya zeae EC1]
MLHRLTQSPDLSCEFAAQFAHEGEMFIFQRSQDFHLGRDADAMLLRQ